MAGHSKWANIQHRKGKQDQKRAKVFTKLIREITTAARMGGMDQNSNPRLRLAISKARESALPNDTIDRAVKRGGGNDASENFEAITYEGYGAAGIAVLVECLTDNRNRTVGEVRHAFSKCGGNLGTDGSVAYLFAKKGQLIFPPDSDEAQIMEIALEAGADDVITAEDNSVEVLTEPDQFEAVKTAFTEKNIIPAQAEVTMIASTQVRIDDQDTIAKIEKLLDMLEDLDDVQNVYSNADLNE